jgi:integrase
VDADMVRVVNDWQIETPQKGDAVRRLDPDFGPFTDTELQGLIEAFARAFESGLINVVQFSLLMLLQATGRRPWQLMNMRLKDLFDVSTGDGAFRYFANVPRVKQRGRGFRQEFRKAELIRDIWDLLQIQRCHVIATFTAQSGSAIPDALVRELPLFHSPVALREVLSLKDIEDSVPLDILHMRREDFMTAIRGAVLKCAVFSERTDRALHVFARRFRYTIASRAAREGFGVSVIAELLDHSNNDSAYIYTLNVPEHGAHIDRVVGKHLAAVASAFAGRVVKNKTEAVRGLEPGSDIRSTSGHGSGTCGNGGACRANVPIPCYTCHFFQPWLDGPHEEFHAELIAQRIEILDVTGDAAVATALDRTIQAVAEVVAICTERKLQSD